VPGARPADGPDTSFGMCRLCHVALPPPLLSLGRQALDDRSLAAGAEEPPRADLALTICGTCALIQLAGPRVERVPGLVHGYSGAFSSTLRDEAAAWAAELMGDRSGPGLRILDVADGRSGVFDALRAHGATVVAGSEPPTGFDLAGATALVAAGGPFDLIVADHALAHADDLDALLAAVRLALAPDGRLAIDAHDACGLVEGQFDIANHAHRSYLTMTAIESALTRHDLGALSARPLPAHGGTLRVMAGRRGVAAVDADGAMAAQRRRERIAGLDDGSGLRRVQAQAEAIAAGLRSFIEGVVDRGETIAGYGAAARGATLLAFARIGAADLPVIYDRDPSKAGRHLPVSGIAIREADALETDRPDWLLVLPWPLADEIARQSSDLRARGTRFVVALPSLRVLA
jgi:SAM-dependent methyltransferase